MWWSAWARRFRPTANGDRFRQRTGIHGRTAIYIGRIDENKGCAELFEYWQRYSEITPGGLTLVLIGTPVLPVPSHPRIRHLGFVSDDDKYDALQAAEFLIMPSYFESLSMVALEAWGMGKPVLANGRCDVLRGQAIRSNAGLYYDSYPEFVEAVRVLESSPGIAATLGRNGRRFFQEHYTWPIVEKKYLDMFARLRRGDGRSGRPGDGAASRLVAATAAVAASGARGPRRTAEWAGARLESWSRIGRRTTLDGGPRTQRATSTEPPEQRHHREPRDQREGRDQRDQREARPAPRTTGSGAPGAPRSRSRPRSRPRSARRAAGAAGTDRASGPAGAPANVGARADALRPANAGGNPSGRRRPEPAGTSAAPAARQAGGLMPEVHQVLATLGYGDAIGHEVLGIQRVLRGAGYESEIFVETADARLEHLTVDYRDLPDASHPDNLLIHHFSIGSRASRVAYALPDRMALVYHNITPPEFFVDVHPLLVQLCYLGRRELGALRRPRASSPWATPSSTASSSRRSGFADTAVLPVVPDFSHLAGPANFMQAGAFDDDWVNLLFVGRMIPNKRIEDLDPVRSTPTSAGSTRARGCCWSARTAASSATWRCCTTSSPASAPPTCTSSATSATRS